ncbi:amidohydrolase [Arthrobacter sp. R4-81]
MVHPSAAAPSDVVLASIRQPGDSECSDIHIAGGVVSRISPAGDHPARPTVVDFDGGCAIPGLWDEHVHMTQWALAAQRLDLSRAESATNAVELLRPHLGGMESDTTLVGVGFRDAVWSDAPTLEMLDAVTRRQPTALLSHDLHCVWLNSAAAKRYGVFLDADGLLREDAAFAVTRQLDQLPDPLVDGWVADAARIAASRGIVGIVDFEMAWNRDAWMRREAAGFDSVRVDVGVYAEHLGRAAGLGLRTGQAFPGSGLLRVGPMKVLIDGSLNTRTAFCVDPYPHGGKGVLTVSEAELLALLERAGEAGFVPAVHAIGDAANKVALDAFERAGIPGRIEHAQFVRQQDFRRFADLNVTASVQPLHALDDRDAAEANWAGHTDRAFPLRSLLEAGAMLALGSDAPVAPLDPWAAMSAATTRSRQDGREPWHPEQSITRKEALAASARGRKRIQVGDRADIAILDGDPLAVPDDVFARMPVAATVVGGRFTYNG